jgi:hypothetical protein
MLTRMRLSGPFSTLIPNIVDCYEHKIALWQKMIEISSAFVGGPKPNVDYQEIAAEMPKVRAQLDYIDQTLFQSSPLVFGTLIDMKANSKNQADHLIITQAERQGLIDTINTEFGPAIDQKEQDYTVSGAAVIKAYLLKDFKSSDDPWE